MRGGGGIEVACERACFNIMDSVGCFCWSYWKVNIWVLVGSCSRGSAMMLKVGSFLGTFMSYIFVGG